MAECLFCSKDGGHADEPVGGYIYRDERWIVNHAHPQVAQAGTLIASSRRHYLDVTEMTEDEAMTFRALERRLIRAVKRATGAERVYTVAMMANVPHFHTWFIPQHPGSAVKALELLATKRHCDVTEAVSASERIRDALAVV